MTLFWILLAIWLGLCAGAMLLAGLRMPHTRHREDSDEALTRGETPV